MFMSPKALCDFQHYSSANASLECGFQMFSESVEVVFNAFVNFFLCVFVCVFVSTCVNVDALLPVGMAWNVQTRGGWTRTSPD